MELLGEWCFYWSNKGEWEVQGAGIEEKTQYVTGNHLFHVIKEKKNENWECLRYISDRGLPN